MKRKTFLLLLLVLVAGWLSYLTGCMLLSDPVRDRVSRFVSDINDTDRSQVYLNFHPSITNMAGAQDVATWQAQFPVAKIPYTMSLLVTGDPSNVTFRITNLDGLSWDVRFTMELQGSDWMISVMYMDPAPNALPTTVIID